MVKMDSTERKVKARAVSEFAKNVRKLQKKYDESNSIEKQKLLPALMKRYKRILFMCIDAMGSDKVKTSMIHNLEKIKISERTLKPKKHIN
jgi:hypothetical protein